LLITALATTGTVSADAQRVLLAPPAPKLDPLTAFRVMVERWNAGDAASAADCFHERAVFRGNPLLPDGGCLGRDSIRTFLAHTAAINIETTIAGGRSSSNGVGGRLEVTSDRIRRRGIDRVRFSYYAEVRDADIVLLHLTADINDEDTAEYVAYVRNLRVRGAEIMDAPAEEAAADEVEVVDGEVIGEYREIPDVESALTGPAIRRSLLVAGIVAAAALFVAIVTLRRRRRRMAVPEAPAAPLDTAE
jgi:hypothetical protein